MREPLNLKYYRGDEPDNLCFYRIPKVLFTKACFEEVSTDAKVLYGILLDYASLSRENRWLDENMKGINFVRNKQKTAEPISILRKNNLFHSDTSSGTGGLSPLGP